ncbi:MAG TPA: endolytic transglycosylase MltG [Haliangium sp.]|nr:endolytic transglycosylase MltG [Haliangium sp.]
MSKRSFRIALLVVLATLCAAGVAVAFVANRALTYPETPHDGTAEAVPVPVAPGMSFPRIASLLADRGIIDRPRWFRLYAMQRGVTTKVRSGDYVLRGNMTPREVLDTLLAGVQEETVRVTIPEGLHMLEIFDIIARAGVAPADELEKLARDPTFLSGHGIDGDTADGYLFPDTYQFRVPSRPDEVLGAMIEQHRLVWDRIRRQSPREIDQLHRRLGWTDRDILTMAAIVEKEAAVAAERPRIAQVFINRLTSPSFQPRTLDTDPTIRYGCMVPLSKSEGCRKWDPSQRLRRAQLDDRDNPYNTYQHEGLPPGPICNPGEAALTATVKPDGSNYFYFVARNDGTHVFSRTRQEHERAVDQYQR